MCFYGKNIQKETQNQHGTCKLVSVQPFFHLSTFVKESFTVTEIIRYYIMINSNKIESLSLILNRPGNKTISTRLPGGRKKESFRLGS